jgi:hypothetical protein
MATKRGRQGNAALTLRSRAELTGTTIAELLAGQIEDEEQAAIVRKTQTDLLRQGAVAIKKRRAEQVIETGAVGTAHRIVGLAEALQALRSRVQDGAVQQRIDQALVRVEQEHVEAQLRLQIELEDHMEAIVGSSADPQVRREEEYIVERPNLLQQFFGGQTKITRVRR